MQAIQAIGPAALQPPLVASSNFARLASSTGPSFKDLLRDSVQQLNATQQTSPTTALPPASANKAAATEVLSGAEQAGRVLDVAMQVQNKLLAAYDEIKNLRI